MEKDSGNSKGWWINVKAKLEISICDVRGIEITSEDFSFLYPCVQSNLETENSELANCLSEINDVVTKYKKILLKNREENLKREYDELEFELTSYSWEILKKVYEFGKISSIVKNDPSRSVGNVLEKIKDLRGKFMVSYYGGDEVKLTDLGEIALIIKKC